MIKVNYAIVTEVSNDAPIEILFTEEINSLSELTNKDQQICINYKDKRTVYKIELIQKEYDFDSKSLEQIDIFISAIRSY